MQVPPEQLPEQLSRGLAPFYLLFGNEPLLVQEARDAIRAAATAAGIDEWQLMQIEGTRRKKAATARKRSDSASGEDNGDDPGAEDTAEPGADQWRAVAEQADSRGLFASRRVLDVRMKKGVDAAAETALLRLIERLQTDDVLIVSMGAVDKRAQTKAWFKAAQGAGVVVPIWPVRPNELPRWIEQRARRLGVRLNRDAVKFLAARIEGNLLAAAQQLELVRLLDSGKVWDVAALAATGDDAAHFDVFSLVDGACEGDARRCLQMLRNYRMRGDHALGIAAAFASQLRRLAGMAERIAAGADAESIIAEGQVFGRERQAAWMRVLKRESAASLAALVARFGTLDQQVKGLRRGDPWQTLEAIVLALAGFVPAAAHLDLERFELLAPVGI